MSLDDLRRAAIDQDDDSNSVGFESTLADHDDGRLFGLTAVERMFVSIGIFGITLVISLLLLLVTESIAFNF